MPNWCQNNLTIEHEDRAKVMEFVHAYKEGKVCDHYMPVPRDEKGEVITDESSPHYWYTWCINNWGTKWDIGSDTNVITGYALTGITTSTGVIVGSSGVSTNTIDGIYRVENITKDTSSVS